jgi:hypothetical protein
MGRFAGLAVVAAVALAATSSCGGAGRTSSGAGDQPGADAGPAAPPAGGPDVTPGDGGTAADGTPGAPSTGADAGSSGGASQGGGGGGSGAGGPPPDAGSPPGGEPGAPPSQAGKTRWVVSMQFPQRGLAADGAGGAFASNVRLPLHAPPAPPGSFVVGSDVTRLDAAGHLAWSRTFGPALGCGVFIGFEMAPLPGGHVAATFSEEGCAVSVPELGGQTFERTALVELDGDGRFVKRIADASPSALRASSDGALLFVSLVVEAGVATGTELVKLGVDGVARWRVDAAARGSFVSDVAPARDGGAVLVVVDDDQNGVPIVTHLRRYGGSGALLWTRDLPAQVLGQQAAVLADGSVVAAGASLRDLSWGSAHVQVGPNGAQVLLSLGPDGAPRDAALADATQVTALADGGFLAYGLACRIARYTAELAPLWSRDFAAGPGPGAPCRPQVAGKGAVGASPSLVVVTGSEDSGADFGGGLVTQGDGWVLGLAP